MIPLIISEHHFSEHQAVPLGRFSPIRHAGTGTYRRGESPILAFWDSQSSTLHQSILKETTIRGTITNPTKLDKENHLKIDFSGAYLYVSFGEGSKKEKYCPLYIFFSKTKSFIPQVFTVPFPRLKKTYFWDSLRHIRFPFSADSWMYHEPNLGPL